MVEEMSRADVQKLCLESIKNLRIGVGPEEYQNGKDFYK